MESGAFFVTHTDKSQRSRQPKGEKESTATGAEPPGRPKQWYDGRGLGREIEHLEAALPTGNIGGFLGIGPSIFPARGFVLLSRVDPPFRCCSSSAFASFGLPTFEPIRRQLSVDRGRLNVAVPEIALQGPGVLACAASTTLVSGLTVKTSRTITSIAFIAVSFEFR